MFHLGWLASLRVLVAKPLKHFFRRDTGSNSALVFGSAAIKFLVKPRITFAHYTRRRWEARIYEVCNLQPLPDGQFEERSLQFLSSLAHRSLHASRLLR